MDELLLLLVLVFAVIAILAFSRAQQLSSRLDDVASQLRQLQVRLISLEGQQRQRPTAANTTTAAPAADVSAANAQATAHAAATESTPALAASSHSTPATGEQAAETDAATNAAWQRQSKAAPASAKTPPYKRVESTPLLPTPEWQLNLLRQLKDNWLVWCGGLALVFGLGYLVQFIAHRIETSPATRISIAVFVSAVVIAVGDWLHRKFTDGAAVRTKLGKDYIPAAIIAAGTTGIYAALVFATVNYQLISSPWSMLLIAATAFLSLVSSLRYGSLMAVLGLIGGYLAPLWLASAAPAYFVLTAYICAVSAVGLYVLKRSNLPWLLWWVFAGQLLWLTALTLAVQTLTWWLLIFYPLTAYLLGSVPFRGWTFNGAAIANCRRYQPYWVAIVLSLLLYLTDSIGLLAPSYTASAVRLVILALLLAQPLLHNLGRSARNALRDNNTSLHAPLIGLVTTAVLVGTEFPIDGLFSADFGRLLLFSALWWMFSFAQAYIAFGSVEGDRSQAPNYHHKQAGGSAGWLTRGNLIIRGREHYWWLLLGPQLFIVLLLSYSERFWPAQFWQSSGVSVVVMLVLAGLASQRMQLVREFSTAIHALVFVNIALWADGALFSLLLGAQLVLAVWQMAAEKPPLPPLVIKALVSLLLLRLTLFPFMAEWQQDGWSQWSLALRQFVPALLLTALSWLLLRRHAAAKFSLLIDWLEGALIHLVAVLLFVESHYLVTGSFAAFSRHDFISVSFWLIEAIALCAVYGIRQQRCQHVFMQGLYAGYRQCLLGVALICAVMINLMYLPWWSDSVTGTAMPIVNGLALGWLLPAALLMLANYFQLLPFSAYRRYYYGVSGALAALWLLLSIRQFWQPGLLYLALPTSMAEWLSYSVVLILLGCGFVFTGVRYQQLRWQQLGLALLALAVIKVFLSDIGHLDGVWRVVSFLGLGVALIGIGRLFQVLKQRQAAAL